MIDFKTSNIFIICSTIVLLSMTIAVTHYHMYDRQLMAENINRAVEKGVDPISVRCAYANSQDLICVTFSTTSQSHNTTSPLIKK